MILIFTSKQDVHADEVIRRLTSREVRVFRLNTEDVLTKYRLELRLEIEGEWSGEVTDELGRTLDLRTLRVAWFRKPSFDFELVDGTDGESQGFIASETRAFLETMYSLPSITWINPPFEANKAKTKFQQLLLARKCGVRVPRTVITTKPEVAIEFFRSCGEVALTKAVYSANATIDGRNRGVPSIKISAPEFYSLVDRVSAAPVQLQEYVDKDFELRVTIIGDAVFATRIDSQLHEETKVDWRLYSKLNRYSVFELPVNVFQFCVGFLKAQGLLYGAMDFIVTPGGEFVFLENNPFGQYLWLEQETGAPLTEAVCDMLVGYL